MRILSSTFLPDGKRLVTAHQDAKLRLWDVTQYRLLATLAGHTGQVNARYGRKLLSTDLDFTGKRSLAHVWSIPEGRKLATYHGHGEAGIGVIGVVSPDGRIAATAGGADSTIDLWSLESGQRIKRLAGSGSTVVGVGFATNGGALVWSTQRQFDKASRSSREYQRMRLPGQALDPVGEPSGGRCGPRPGTRCRRSAAW